MSNSKLVGDFKLLREHCVLLRRHYNTYTNLYNEGNHNLLKKVAPTFFSDIEEIMRRDWILQACKLMDPANTKRKDSILENITIKLVNEQLERRGWLSQTINNISEEILEYGDKIKPARNKRLAHFDREHQIKNILVGETTQEELSCFLNNMQKYCDKVGIVIGVGPLDFSCSSCQGDVLDLISYLRGCK